MNQKDEEKDRRKERRDKLTKKKKRNTTLEIKPCLSSNATVINKMADTKKLTDPLLHPVILLKHVFQFKRDIDTNVPFSTSVLVCLFSSRDGFCGAAAVKASINT